MCAHSQCRTNENVFFIFRQKRAYALAESKRQIYGNRFAAANWPTFWACSSSYVIRESGSHLFDALRLLFIYLFISASTLIYTRNKCVCSMCSNQSHFKMMCFEEIYINTKMIPRISLLCIHIWIRRVHETYFIILKFVVPGKEEDVNIKMERIKYRMLSRYNLCSVCINLPLLRSYYKMYENLISKLTRNEIQSW